MFWQLPLGGRQYRAVSTSWTYSTPLPWDLLTPPGPDLLTPPRDILHWIIAIDKNRLIV